MKKEKASRTASKVALNILTLGEVPEMAGVLPSGIIDATAQLLIASGAAGKQTVCWARSRKMVSVYKAFDWMMPGQFEAFAHRKSFCEQQVRKGIAAGATQVLVLGAGYDTMGWRLAPQFPDVSFFEIDHPATARFKAKGIQEMGTRSNLHLIAEDLSQHKLVDILTGNGDWDPRASTIFVAEGLLQYLTQDAVQSLFAQCASISGNGRIIFTYIPTAKNGRPDAGPQTGLVLWLLKIGGEPWFWSVRPEELGAFLAESGWTNAPELSDDDVMHGVELYAVARKPGQV